MRKTRLIESLEAHFGKALVDIVAESYTKHQTIDAAAAALTKESGISVNPNTFAYWLVRLPIEVDVKKVASVRAAA